MASIFDKKTIQDIYKEIQDVYLSTKLPWIVGFSGGKDSSVVIQLIWIALSKLDPSQLNWPIFIISSDTLVENPNVLNQLDVAFEKINTASLQSSLPISTHKVSPAPDQTFWVNIIGRGYAAPTQRFRWCTDRMKIKPSNQFALDRMGEYGQVVMVLGSRRSESISRGQIIANEEEKRTVTGTRLRYHHILGNALVYTPIQEWQTDDVWAYLLNVKSPWGGRNYNRNLSALYRSADDSECPLVVDTSTPSCGSSRFGCWTCTVVARDRSMENMLINDYDKNKWMQPMLKFRRFLSDTQDPAKKHLYRSHRRRNGKIDIIANNEAGEELRGIRNIEEYTVNRGGEVSNYFLIRGPYRMEFRKEILSKLLKTQTKVRRLKKDDSFTLIQPSELHQIRRIWINEEGDWEDSLPAIYESVTNDGSVSWLNDDNGRFTALEKEVLREVCKENNFPAGAVMSLLDAEKRFLGMHRRAGIRKAIESSLSRDWRTEDELENKYGVVFDQPKKSR